MGEAIDQKKYENLFILYELMQRIESTIHSTAQESIKEINKKNATNHNVALEEDQLRMVLRPALACL